ncbi:MAG: FAD-dependent oxidoreductase [Planctomycetes bacterium]|nr:FAD-dependent oxidoreductase [Planctomycetota bacterium]
MTKNWKCEVCGYVHTGLEPPQSCPICGAERSVFSVLKGVQAPPAAKGSASWRCNICGYVHEGDAPPAACPLCGAESNLFQRIESAASPGSKSGEKRKIVILGAGIAGVTAAEQARNINASAEIVLVSKEKGFPYFRLNLTRYLAGEVTEDSLGMLDETWLRERRIEFIEGEGVEIQRQARQVRLKPERLLSYGRLILANGAHPFIPPIPGHTLEGVRAIRTLPDVNALLAELTPDLKIVCIGGGLLGLETAGALAKRGCFVTVLEGSPSLLPRQLAHKAGTLLQRHMERMGISVHTEVKVEEIVGESSVHGVRLQNGVEIPADLVVFATGVRPNSSLARQAGLSVKAGVMVNDRMETSDPNILACGDVAEHSGVLYGIWPASFAQGNVAGINAGGGDAAFERFPPSNRLKVLDINLFSIGQFQPSDASFQMFEEDKNGTYTRLVYRDGKIVGANLFGNTDLTILLKDAVEQGRQIPELPRLLKHFPDFAKQCRLDSEINFEQEGTTEWPA